MKHIATTTDQIPYAVTGEHHGSIVYAKSLTSAKKTFKRHYKGEKILSVKDLSNSNIQNL